MSHPDPLRHDADEVGALLARLDADDEVLSASAADMIRLLFKHNQALLLGVMTADLMIGALLDHCPDAECPVCAEIVCPHADALHFHHDGCPSCAQHEQAASHAPLQ